LYPGFQDTRVDDSAQAIQKEANDDSPDIGTNERTAAPHGLQENLEKCEEPRAVFAEMEI
jgi:hypothetical protein